MDIQVPLTKGHEAGDVQDIVRIDVMELDTVLLEELCQERMYGRGKPSLQMDAKQNAFTSPG